jgi:hypothetical protein
MKKLVLISVIGVLSLFLNSQLHSQTPSFTDVSKAKDYLLDSCIYDVLRWQYPWGMSLSFITNITSDDAVAGGGDETDQPDFQKTDAFALNDSNSVSIALWTKYAEGIRRSNYLIEASNNDSSDMLLYNAEGKFLRAYFCFDLVRTFGEFALDINTPYNRSSISNIYTQIENDLLSAIPNLPEVSELTNNTIDFVTKGAAIGLLGKVYLYQEKWTQANEQFEIIINSKKYSLLTFYEDVWRADNKHSNESLFEIPYTDQYPMDWNGHNKGNFDVFAMGIRGTIGGIVTPDYIAGFGFCKITEQLANAYIFRHDNVRFNSTIINANDLIENGAEIFDTYEYTGYYNRKYSANTIDEPQNSKMFAHNEIVLRYADILLMNAEALYRLGNETDALIMINKVRNRVNLASLNTTGTALFDSIMVERRLELALEGNRFFDLVRWGKDVEVLGELGYKAEKNKNWPYPFINDPDNSTETIVCNNNTISIKGFPNPAKSAITLSYNLQNTGNFQIMVYSANGHVIDNIKLSNNIAGQQQYKLNLNKYKNGIYSVMILTDNTKEVYKIAVIK